MVGKFYVGENSVISQDSIFSMANGKTLEMTNQTHDQATLTYPLWGENVIDWRTPRKSHNNTPPSLNIRVRYYADPKESSTIG